VASNDELQRTSPGQNGASPLNSVLGGRSNGKTEVAPAPARAEATPRVICGSRSARYRRDAPCGDNSISTLETSRTRRYV
jgi:hypothetical protein